MQKLQKQKPGRTGQEQNTLLRTQRIQFRVTTEEYAAISNLTAKSGYSAIAYYVRDKALSSASTAKAEKQAYKKFLNDLARMGNNLNQIARQLNQRQPINREMMQHICDIRLMLYGMSMELAGGQDDRPIF